MKKLHSSLILLFFFLISCENSPKTNFPILYDGCPECEGDEYTTSTKKWNKSTITFAFKGDFPLEQAKVIEDALRIWESKIPLSFSKSTDVKNSDIIISFEKGEHGDGIIFDGEADPEGNLLAHGFFPPPTRGSLAGDLHFDIGDRWTINNRNSNLDPIDIFTVALHEFGHCLGLRHSDEPSSIMFAEYKGSKRDLNLDDINGIQSLYGNKEYVNNSSSSILFNSPTLSGISKSISYKGKIFTIVGYDGALNSVVGYPDSRMWYKTKLINDSGQSYTITNESNSASVSDYSLSLTTDGLMGLVYQYPTGYQYGFVMPIKKFDGSSFVSTENIFNNNNWGINPQLVFDNSNNPHVVSWAAAGYTLLYHQKINSTWHTQLLTDYNTIVLNLKMIVSGNKITLSTRHNLYNNTNQNQTLRLYTKDLTAASWTEINSTIDIDNNCDLLLDKYNQVYHLVYKNNHLMFGTLYNLQTVITLPGIDNRACAIFDDNNAAYIALQTASKVIVYKQNNMSWINIYDENINISNQTLSNTNISLIKANGHIIVVFADQNNVKKKVIN